MDKVSIVIPVYNKANWLRVCLNSVLSQTYPNFEALLIDDGSTDGSKHIVDEYAQRDKRLKVIHQANAGVSAAPRNKGLEMGTGRWLVFLDADDWIDSHYIQNLVEHAVPNGIASFNHYNVWKGVSTCPHYCKHSRKYSIKQEEGSYHYNEVLGYEWSNLLTLYPKIYDFSILRENNLRFNTEHSFGEDTLFNLEFLLYATMYKVSEEKMGYYRVRDA